jgi:hypothetical protein
MEEKIELLLMSQLIGDLHTTMQQAQQALIKSPKDVPLTIAYNKSKEDLDVTMDIYKKVYMKWLREWEEKHSLQLNTFKQNKTKPRGKSAKIGNV